MTEETDGVSITELVRAVFICAFCTTIHENFLTLSLYIHMTLLLYIHITLSVYVHIAKQKSICTDLT